tara:strand:- start:3907 stop:5406 length:1500 start_codon:yes stop_codon:yes gene_type:complete
MAIKRYYATKDNTITNAFKSNLQTRGVSGNMGQSDILEMFSIYGQASSSVSGLSSELSRVLIEFDVTQINADRTSGVIPASGSVNFFLRMYDAEHTQTTPKNYTLVVSAISQSWSEGLGLDMEEYTDLDASNWVSASDGVKWIDHQDVLQPGGSYKTGSDALPNEYLFSQSFDTGFENLDLDVSHLVEDWIKGDLNNYGFGIRLTSSNETAEQSYYTKMFFARGSQFFHKRPVIEARFDDSKKDNRGDFFLSSSLVPAADNLMNLYLYNVVRGELKDIPGLGTSDGVQVLNVNIYSGSTGPLGSKLKLPVGGNVKADGHTNITASRIETGIYSCSFAYVSSSITSIFDVWNSGSIEYHTGSAITVKTFNSQNYNFDQKYISKVTNLRSTYNQGEKVRFRLYTRQKDWSPTIYTVASSDIETTIVDNAYYRFTRVSDNLDVIPFGTGSLNHTRLSYDTSGSYFDLEMSLFDTDTVYELSFAYLINGSYVEQPERFRFRVE